MKKPIRTVAIGLILLLSSIEAHALNSPVSCEELRREYDQYYRKDFGITGLGLRRDCSGRMGEIARALSLMYHELPESYHWAKDHIDEMGWGLQSTKQANASFHPKKRLRQIRVNGTIELFEEDVREVILWDSFFKKEPELQAAIIYHEAAHDITQKHVPCNNKSKYRHCDEKFYDLKKQGAFNYHFGFLKELWAKAESSPYLDRNAITEKMVELLNYRFIDTNNAVGWLSDLKYSRDAWQMSPPIEWPLLVEYKNDPELRQKIIEETKDEDRKTINQAMKEWGVVFKLDEEKDEATKTLHQAMKEWGVVFKLDEETE